MNINQFAELASTFTEALVVNSFVTNVCKRRFDGAKHILLLLGFTILQAIAILYLNSINLFSYATIIFCFITSVMIAKLTSLQQLISRATAAIVIYFVIAAIDYIVVLAMGLIQGDVSFTASVATSQGTGRNIFLLIDKSVDVVVYLICREFLPKFPALKRNYLISIFVAALVPYVVMSALFSSVVNEDVFHMQTAILFSWIIILLFLFMIVLVFYLVSKSNQQEYDNKMLSVINEASVKSYRLMDKERERYYSVMHDNDKHLVTMKSLMDAGEWKEAENYLYELIKTSEELPRLCHSGEAVIDAVINSKIIEAQQRGIKFEFSAKFPNQTTISKSDICAVIVNQIDNAFEACQKISDESRRYVKVEIWLKNQFAFFRVSNSITDDPFKSNARLVSTKTDKSVPHGIGIKNIKDVAERYNGVLDNYVENGTFISSLSLSFTTV